VNKGYLCVQAIFASCRFRESKRSLFVRNCSEQFASLFLPQPGTPRSLIRRRGPDGDERGQTTACPLSSLSGLWARNLPQSPADLVDFHTTAIDPVHPGVDTPANKASTRKKRLSTAWKSEEFVEKGAEIYAKALVESHDLCQI
jgi:hypothetical protein